MSTKLKHLIDTEHAKVSVHKKTKNASIKTKIFCLSKHEISFTLSFS